MPIFVHCDICKRIMGETTVDRFKKFRRVHGERCGQCTQIFEELDQFTNKAKKIQIKKMDELFAQTKQDVEHEIHRVTQLPPRRRTLWSWIKGIFVRGVIEIQEPLPKEEEPDKRLEKHKLANRGDG
jgi:hypothetical protein